MFMHNFFRTGHPNDNRRRTTSFRRRGNSATTTGVICPCSGRSRRKKEKIQRSAATAVGEMGGGNKGPSQGR